MNIAFVVHNYHRREGTGRYVVELLPRVASQHDVTLYAARIREPVPPGVTTVRVHAIMLRTVTAIASFPPAFALVRRPHDIVHAQGWVAGSADVVTAHIVQPAWSAAVRAAHLELRAGERLWGPFVAAREARLYGHGAGHVIVPSNKVRDELATYYGRRTEVTVVHHGFPSPAPITDPRAARHQLGLPADSLIALFVGDIHKGLDAAVAAVGRRLEYHLAVVSRSRPGQAARLANDARLGHRFHWLGHLTDVSAAYGAADVLIHPTVYDSFGLVIAEAMASGVPPVVTRNAGITELIQHGESGWVVDEDRVTGTEAALRALAADAALRRRLGAGARMVAERRNWDDVARDTVAVYERIARGLPPRRPDQGDEAEDAGS